MEPLADTDPRSIGGFAVEARLGSGGMGAVYLGRSASGRLVAIKVVHEALAADREFQERFAREVAAMRTVGGFWSAAVVDADPRARPPWLATEFIAGPSLAEAVGRDGPLNPVALRTLVSGLAEALAAIHRAGLVHRDLKPSNVLLAADGPRVIDFGIARAFEATSLTATSHVVGTPGYMAPEQLTQGTLSAASDVFCLAVTIAYAATGRPPFGLGGMVELSFRVVNGEPDLAGVPDWLLPLLTACLAKDPAARPTPHGILQWLRGDGGQTVVLPSVAGPGAAPTVAANAAAPIGVWNPPTPAAGSAGPTQPSKPGPGAWSAGGGPIQSPSRGRVKVRATLAAGGAVVVAAGLAAAFMVMPSSHKSALSGGASGGPTGGQTTQDPDVVVRTGADITLAGNVAEAGGMDALVDVAKKEGTLNLIAIPRDWANYGAIMDGFTAKYGIKITDADPEGSSQDEINALTAQRGAASAPDVVDIGLLPAIDARLHNLFTEYQVANWNAIPDSLKDPQGDYYGDFGGYISIGYDAKKVAHPPTSLKAMDDVQYRQMISLNGDPNTSTAALDGFVAAGLANGGSLSYTKPGIDFFRQLKADGVFVPSATAVPGNQAGRTPITIDMDYNQAAIAAGPQGADWKTIIPSDALVGEFSYQAISATATHPAAARLWEEYLYSTEGQNLFLKGKVRPVEFLDPATAKGADPAALAALPTATKVPMVMSESQIADAKSEVKFNWQDVTGG
ncbi:ABC-type Fe3+ transport system substrate-binding protein [Catenulispora sp. MAP5-51]|uniref:protein kinase domain-containing protein n=1 Tax=Catenulispora sp. MAP5-51 TaxID=3156298 RepID=UPI003516E8DD